MEGANAAVRAVPDANSEGQAIDVVATAIARELSAFIWAINRGVVADHDRPIHGPGLWTACAL